MSKLGFPAGYGPGKVSRRLQALTCALVLVVLCSCGGGGSSSGSPVPSSASCSTDAQKDWLRSYMLDWYLWSGASPNPATQGYASLASYFAALLYPGGGVVPAQHQPVGRCDRSSFDLSLNRGSRP